jgi:hypothetical protein
MDVLVCEAACLGLPPLAASLFPLYNSQLEISEEMPFSQEDLLHKLVGSGEVQRLQEIDILVTWRFSLS